MCFSLGSPKKSGRLSANQDGALDEHPLRIFLPKEAQKVCSRLATRNRNSGQTMAFFNMQKGEVPYLKSLADQYARSDNYHSEWWAGTGPQWKPCRVAATPP